MLVRSTSRSSCLVSTSLALAALVGSAPAFAQEPLPSEAPATQPVVTPAPGQAAASAPSRTAIPITATCSLGDHPGIDPDEAKTAADVLCHELAKVGATNSVHEIRFGKLGGKLLVTVASREGNKYDERRTLLAGMDELPVAAPRLAGALADGRSLEETRNVDNVLASEARSPKVQRGQMGFDGGIFGMTGLGAASGGAGGVHLGLLYRAGSFGISSHGRAGGIGSGEKKISTASIDFGGRYYLTNADIAPFVGVGVGLSYFELQREKAPSLDGSGFGAYGVVGLEMFRSQHAALSASLRIDAPFYELGSASDARYVAPLSLNVGLVFH